MSRFKTQCISVFVCVNWNLVPVCLTLVAIFKFSILYNCYIWKVVRYLCIIDINWKETLCTERIDCFLSVISLSVIEANWRVSPLTESRFFIEAVLSKEASQKQPFMFLRKVVRKICSKFTGEHPCRSTIPINLFCNFVEITLRHGCSPVNLLHTFQTPFLKSIRGFFCFQFSFWWYLSNGDIYLQLCPLSGIFGYVFSDILTDITCFVYLVVMYKLLFSNWLISILGENTGKAFLERFLWRTLREKCLYLKFF